MEEGAGREGKGREKERKPRLAKVSAKSRGPYSDGLGEASILAEYSVSIHYLRPSSSSDEESYIIYHRRSRRLG